MTCFEREGRGHKSFECTTRLKREGKKVAMPATLSDSEEDIKDSKDESSQGKFVAFSASHVSIISLSHDDEDTCARETPEEDLSGSRDGESECASESDSELRSLLDICMLRP